MNRQYAPHGGDARGPDAADRAQRPRETPAPQAGGGANIYVVDDDEAARDSLEFLLAALGWKVHSFPGAAECLETLARAVEQPACVVTDLWMPVIDGAQLAAAIRGMNPQLPVIVVTAFDFDSSLARAAQAAGARLLEKPVNLAALETALRDIGRSSTIAHDAAAPGRPAAATDEPWFGTDPVAATPGGRDELLQLAYLAAHDLQMPANSVIELVHLLRLQLAEVAGVDLHRTLNLLEECGNRMRQMIRQLMTLARTDGQVDRGQTVDLGDIARRETLLLGLAGASPSAQLHIDGELPLVRGNAVELTQLLQNLVGNAAKFHEAGNVPQVRLSAQRHPQGWQLTVADNGIGIARAHLQRVFDPFTRLHSAERYPGTGLGLALCKRVVERHGGQIWAESEPGRGSRFHFVLHAAEPPP